MNQGNLGATCLTFWYGSTFTGIYLTKPISIIGIQLVCDQTFQVHDTSVIPRTIPWTQPVRNTCFKSGFFFKDNDVFDNEMMLIHVDN